MATPYEGSGWRWFIMISPESLSMSQCSTDFDRTEVFSLLESPWNKIVYGCNVSTQFWKDFFHLHICPSQVREEALSQVISCNGADYVFDRRRVRNVFENCVFRGEENLSPLPDGQHVQLLVHQLFLSSSFLPLFSSLHALLRVMHAHSCSLIFSFYCKHFSLCDGEVGGVFASHMAVPRASGADVLGIGGSVEWSAFAHTNTLLSTHTHTHLHKSMENVMRQNLTQQKRSLTDRSIIYPMRSRESHGGTWQLAAWHQSIISQFVTDRCLCVSVCVLFCFFSVFCTFYRHAFKAGCHISNMVALDGPVLTGRL